MRKYWKVLLLTLLLVISMLAIPVSAAEDVSAVNNARNGVVRVFSVMSNGVGTGTAFGVGKAGEDTLTFITNRHVVIDESTGQVCDEIYLILETGVITYVYDFDNQGNLTNFSLDISNDFASKTVPCKVIYTTDNYPDIAIIQAISPVSGIKALPLMSSYKLHELQTVYALGYPGVGDVDKVEFVGQSTMRKDLLADVTDVTLTSGEISRFTTISSMDNTEAIVHSAHINGGNSGGPLLTNEGAVVGINTYTYAADEAYTESIFIDYAMFHLDRLNIYYDAYPPEEESKPLPVTAIVAAAAGVIVVVLLILVLRKKKNDSGDQDGKSGPAAQFTLRALTGVLQGQSWSISSTPLLLGREHHCGVKFPDQYKNISRTHCQVAVQNGMVMLTDMGSKFGTFINGQRLAANVPVALRPGDVFYLVEQGDSFTIS